MVRRLSLVSPSGYKGAWHSVAASAMLESELCDGGKAPFLEQLKTGQNGPEW